MTRYLIAILLCGIVATNLSAQDWRDDIGYNDLLDYLGGSLTDDGAGLNVVMPEAPLGNGTYMPNVGSSEFSGKTIVNGTPGGQSGTSGHSNSVANLFYGNAASITPGITDITVYDANDYLNRILLNNGGDPLAQGFDIGNHSYVIANADDAVVENLLQRFDFIANRDNTVMVHGVNNGSGNSTPEVFSPSYNSIAVGRTDGIHSRGQTNLYGAPRFKPDIVAPGINPVNGFSATSFATPKVSSSAALLRQAAGNSNATQNEVVRALLFAGATKEEFDDWDRTTTRPIDEVYGFGELNIFNSYMILQGGRSRRFNFPAHHTD